MTTKKRINRPARINQLEVKVHGIKTEIRRLKAQAKASDSPLIVLALDKLIFQQEKLLREKRLQLTQLIINFYKK